MDDVDGAARDGSAGEPKREFAFTSADFRAISKLVSARTGIQLPESKSSMVYGRLARRLRELGLTSFRQYREVLQDKVRGPDELVACVNALTTNLTRFFRESHHFDILRTTVLPHVERHGLRTETGRRRLRIWSAGCSSGEEPYSIALVLADWLKGNSAWDARILATDLDSAIVRRASLGRYGADATETVPPKSRAAHFTAVRGEDGRKQYEAGPSLKRLITFKQLNLLDPWPMRGPFDAIFCRNVMIYFDKPTQATLVDRYADMLVPDGRLFIGHSENLFKLTDRFAVDGRTVYRRVS